MEKQNRIVLPAVQFPMGLVSNRDSGQALSRRKNKWLLLRANSQKLRLDLDSAFTHGTRKKQHFHPSAMEKVTEESQSKLGTHFLFL
jgi:hypothetical protein